MWKNIVRRWIYDCRRGESHAGELADAIVSSRRVNYVRAGKKKERKSRRHELSPDRFSAYVIFRLLRANIYGWLNAKFESNVFITRRIWSRFLRRLSIAIIAFVIFDRNADFFFFRVVKQARDRDVRFRVQLSSKWRTQTIRCDNIVVRAIMLACSDE